MDGVVLVRHSEQVEPGTWRHHYVFGDDERTDAGVSITCPQCGTTSRLRDPLALPARADGTHGHVIAADGTVAPSVVCPLPGCGWHVWARLDGWA
jgi:hypothetical protein